jgi:predicted DNA-binding transcriptional regulator YafY
MNRIDRLFGILTLLQTRKYVTGERISEKFNISVRTVYRDVKALCEQGIPVSFEPNRGYFITPGFFLPPVSFTSEEANALLLIEGIVNGFTDRSIQKHYATALNKVKAVLPHTQKERLELLNHTIKSQLPDCFKNDYDYLSNLQQSISIKNIIVLDYTNMKNEVSKREVEPIGLVFYAMSWHLIAWCHKRNAYRDFKVSRILNVTNTEIPFTKTDHMPMDDYMKRVPVSY